MILPRATMTFASNDPGLRAAYSPTVFVGDRYTGDLAASEALTLTRPDGSVADTLTYGGPDWPVPTSGQSLELTNLTAENSLGTNWAFSTGSGTPGTTGGGGPVITAPGAPTVGTAYHFKIAATNTAGTSAYSASSNTITPAATTVPGPPIIGTPSRGATGGALTVGARWTPPTTTGGSAITGYRVTALRMSSSTADATVLSQTNSPILSPSTRQRSFTLSAGNYRFEVVAINAIGTSQPSTRSTNIVPR